MSVQIGSLASLAGWLALTAGVQAAVFGLGCWLLWAIGGPGK